MLDKLLDKLFPILYKQLLNIPYTLNFLRKEVSKMSQQLDQLQSVVSDLAKGEQEEEDRLDAIIAALQAPHDSPEVAAVITQLQELKDRQAAYRRGEIATPPTLGGTDVPANKAAADKLAAEKAAAAEAAASEQAAAEAKLAAETSEVKGSAKAPKTHMP